MIIRDSKEMIDRLPLESILIHFSMWFIKNYWHPVLPGKVTQNKDCGNSSLWDDMTKKSRDLGEKKRENVVRKEVFFSFSPSLALSLSLRGSF